MIKKVPLPVDSGSPSLTMFFKLKTYKIIEVGFIQCLVFIKIYTKTIGFMISSVFI